MVQASHQRIEIGSIAYSFAKIIKGLWNHDMSDVLQDLPMPTRINAGL